MKYLISILLPVVFFFFVMIIGKNDTGVLNDSLRFIVYWPLDVSTKFGLLPYTESTYHKWDVASLVFSLIFQMMTIFVCMKLIYKKYNKAK